jgi:tetratricopeptide (TPR) repeat protein
MPIYYQQALAMAEPSKRITQQIGDLRGESLTLSNLGETLIKQGHYTEALATLQSALKISQEQGDLVREASTYKYLAMLHQATGELDLANHYDLQASSLAIPLEGLNLTSLQNFQGSKTIIEQSQSGY